MVLTGLARFKDEPYIKFFEGNRIGLIVNPASVDHEYRHACDIFAMQKEFKLTALFGPQHGIRGETQDNMIEWEGFTDGKTGVPVFSLYGNTRQPTDDMLADVDVLVFDVQDVGTRVYTFIYTMALSMISCARLGKRFVVLDRPNPIGGEVEGNLLDPSFASFVGLYPIPMRHGMTIAELARLFNYAFEINCELEVVPMEGWSREMSFEETELPWVFPSPNMPTPDTALVYPGSVLFEGTNISEARGTTRPFELIGAPWVNPHTLVKKLEAYDLPGVHFRECWFMPTFHKWSGVMCGGVQIHVTDRRRFPSYAAGVCLLAEIRAQATDSFEWKQPPYEYEYEKLPIDLICGTDFVRLEIEKGTNPLDIVSTSFSDLEKFSSLRGEYLLY